MCEFLSEKEILNQYFTENRSNFRWKDAFNETTEKLQSELVHLQSENSRLIAENQKLNRELRKHH